MPRKRDPIERAFKTIAALEKGVTASELAEILDFNGSSANNRYSSAMYWIDRASLHYPVVEVEKRHSRGRDTGRLATVYGLLK